MKKQGKNVFKATGFRCCHCFPCKMLPGLRRANWLPPPQELQCSLSNWPSLRKPVKKIKQIDTLSIKLSQFLAHLRKNTRNHEKLKFFVENWSIKLSTKLAVSPTRDGWYGIRHLLLMCSINPSKHYMIQFLERSSNGAIGNTVLVEIEIHSMMIWFHSQSSYTYILGTDKKALTPHSMQSINIQKIDVQIAYYMYCPGF